MSAQLQYDVDTMRRMVLDEARSWVGTPYHNCSDIKGVGCDCIMLLVRVYTAVGLIPETTDPRPYSPDWFMHRDEERYLNGIVDFCRKVETPQPADIALYKFGRTVSHASIIVDDNLMIHAHRQARMVLVEERRSIESRLHSYWSRF